MAQQNMYGTVYVWNLVHRIHHVCAYKHQQGCYSFHYLRLQAWLHAPAAHLTSVGPVALLCVCDRPNMRVFTQVSWLWRKYAIEENNNGLICKFQIVHNKFNIML
jgi:hypothetical protein